MTNVIAIDTETTSLRPDRRVWELGLIVPGELGFMFGSRAEEKKGHFRWFVQREDLDLGNADPFALKVGGFYERHPQLADDARGHVTSEADVLRQVERITRGAHLLGAVPNFDADVLDRRMRAHGIAPSWHYHLIDIEAMAVGYLAGLTRGYRSDTAAAGRYTRADAEYLCSLRSWAAWDRPPETMVLAPPADLLGSPNLDKVMRARIEAGTAEAIALRSARSEAAGKRPA